MNMYFTITTSKNTAERIIRQYEYDKKFNPNKSYELGEVSHETDYSLVQIKSKTYHKIEPSDIFFLGLFSGLQEKNFFEQSPPQWIPVSEKMPEENTGTVLVVNEGKVRMGFYHKAIGWVIETIHNCEVTHWMPKPNLPTK